MNDLLAACFFATPGALFGCGLLRLTRKTGSSSLLAFFLLAVFFCTVLLAAVFRGVWDENAMQISLALPFAHVWLLSCARLFRGQEDREDALGRIAFAIVLMCISVLLSFNLPAILDCMSAAAFVVDRDSLVFWVAGAMFPGLVALPILAYEQLTGAFWNLLQALCTLCAVLFGSRREFRPGL